MAEQYHGTRRTKTSGTGGKLKKRSDKKLHAYGGPFTATRVGEEDVRELRAGRGRRYKIKLKTAAYANVLTKEGMKRVKIRTVVETPDNRHHARMNIITKGAILDTEIGKVKVTNRVGQDGIVNAVLLP